MKKGLTFLLLVLMLSVGACSDDEAEVKQLPPDDFSNLADESKEDNIKKEPGEVHIITIAADKGSEQMVSVLNEAIPANILPIDQENKDLCFFTNHENIKLHVTNSYEDFNPNREPSDIVNSAFLLSTMEEARQFVAQLEDTDKFPAFPLIVSAASGEEGTFTQELWDLCLDAGGLNWYTNIRSYFGYTEEDEEKDKIPAKIRKYKNISQNVAAAYIVQDINLNGHVKDLIVAGELCEEGNLVGNRPGIILKDRFVCTYNEFEIEGENVKRMGFASSYIAKIAAEIKRRVPQYSNDEIAQLIFSTTDDLGEEGCDEVFGWGRMNPTKIWVELERRTSKK